MEAKSLKEEVAFCDPHTRDFWPKGSPALMSFVPLMLACPSSLILGSYLPSPI